MQNTINILHISAGLLGFFGHAGAAVVGELKPGPELRAVPHICVGARTMPTRSPIRSLPRGRNGTLTTRWPRGTSEGSMDQNPDLILIASGGEKEQTSYNTWGHAGHRRRVWRH